MAIIEISDVGNYGLSQGAPYHELPPGMWTRAKNMRFRDMAAEKINGHSQALGDLPNGANPIYMMQTISPSGTVYWLYADLDSIFATDGTTHAEISKTATTYNAAFDTNWNGGNLNGIPVLNNGVDVPQYWQDWDVSTPALCTDIPGFSSVYDKVKVVRPFLNFLIALDVTESSTRYPYMVAWSDVADAGSLPTSWDYTSTTNRAGKNILAGEGGVIIDGLPLGNAFIIYKEGAIHTMRFIGGAPVFDFKQITQEVGALSRRCIANWKGGHLVLAQGDVLIHNGGQPESILDQNERTKRLRNWFFNQIDDTTFRRSFVVPNYRKNEIWCCIPESGKDFPTLALVWNYKENTFGVRELLDTVTSGANKVYGMPHITYGVVADSGPVLWDSAVGTWEDQTELWDVAAYNPSVLKLLMANYGETTGPTTGKLFVADTGGAFDGNTYEAYVERQGLAIIGRRNDGGYNVDTQVNKFVRAIYPRIEVISGTGLIDVYVGGQQTIDGPITWEMQQFNPLTDEKVNFTVNGRFIAVKFLTQSSSTLLWKLRGYALDIEPGAKW